jgi:hypothetical protein
MNKKKLSDLYSRATQRIHSLTTELYEDLHTNSGDPIESAEEIATITTVAGSGQSLTSFDL